MFFLLVLDELFKLPISLQILIQRLHLLLKLFLLIQSCSLQHFEVILSLVSFFIVFPGLIYRLAYLTLFLLYFLIQILVDLIYVIFFLSKLIDFVSKFLIVSNGCVKLLICLFQLILQATYLLKEILHSLRPLRLLSRIIRKIWVLIQITLLLHLLLLLIMNLTIHLTNRLIQTQAPIELLLDFYQVVTLHL